MTNHLIDLQDQSYSTNIVKLNKNLYNNLPHIPTELHEAWHTGVRDRLQTPPGRCHQSFEKYTKCHQATSTFDHTLKSLFVKYFKLFHLSTSISAIVRQKISSYIILNVSVFF